MEAEAKPEGTGLLSAVFGRPSPCRPGCAGPGREALKPPLTKEDGAGMLRAPLLSPTPEGKK